MTVSIPYPCTAGISTSPLPYCRVVSKSGVNLFPLFLRGKVGGGPGEWSGASGGMYGTVLWFKCRQRSF